MTKYALIALFLLIISCKESTPETKNTSFKIGVIADCQYCHCDSAGDRIYKNAPAKLQQAVSHLNTKPLTYAIHLGDFIDRDFNSFDTISPIWNSLKPLKYHVLGNHDFSVADSLKPLVFDKMNIKNRYYSFTHNNWRFIVLDGNDLSYHGALTTEKKSQTDSIFKLLSQQNLPNLKPWNGGLSNKQLQWVKNELETATANNENVGFYCHFPALGQTNDHNLWNYKQFNTLIKDYNCVKFYFNGHNHAGDYIKKNGIHYLNFKGMLDFNDSTAYATVAFSKDSILVDGFGRETSRRLGVKRE